MAVAPTGAIYKALKFDGVSSRTYGVYITGEAVYNAPERDVEMITIPGRNGNFALDNGRFQNIEVSYPAGIFAETEADFRQAISDFRNFLCSRKGYVRLQDEYNPDEYRMAVYKSGLEVDPAMLRAGEFDIVFDCKPQRFLTSGETAVSVDSGDTLTNPTLFEASPLLEIEGYGTLNVNGTEIELDDELVGEIVLPSQFQSSTPMDIVFPPAYISRDDAIELSRVYVFLSFQRATNPSQYSFRQGDSSIVSWSGYATESPYIRSSGSYSGSVYLVFTHPVNLQYGRFEARTLTCTARLCFRRTDTQTDFFHNVTIKASLRYAENNDNLIRIDVSISDMSSSITNTNRNAVFDGGTIQSTATTYGHPTYIDCDLGEAYTVDDGVISSLNSYIALGSELPKLSVGESEITYDDTIDELKVSPRWWKI